MTFYRVCTYYLNLLYLTTFRRLFPYPILLIPYIYRPRTTSILLNNLLTPFPLNLYTSIYIYRNTYLYLPTYSPAPSMPAVTI
jgi:hypothetical protein